MRSRLRALWIALAASAGTVPLACTERERPGLIGDATGDNPGRALSGSFSAPDAGAFGGADPAYLDRDAGLGGPGSTMTGADGGASIGSSAVVLQQTYEGLCDGSTVQWGFFTFEAATPGDSSIAFRVRTAAAEEELESEIFLDLLTASAALGTARCGFAGPAPCPIDLYDSLGGAPLAHHPFAQLRVVLSPASADRRMPAVQAWQLTYSCTFNQ